MASFTEYKKRWGSNPSLRGGGQYKSDMDLPLCPEVEEPTEADDDEELDEEDEEDDEEEDETEDERVIFSMLAWMSECVRVYAHLNFMVPTLRCGRLVSISISENRNKLTGFFLRLGSWVVSPVWSMT